MWLREPHQLQRNAVIGMVGKSEELMEYEYLEKNDMIAKYCTIYQDNYYLKALITPITSKRVKLK